MSDEEAKEVVSGYRSANVEIAELWAELDAAAIEAVIKPDNVIRAAEDKLHFLRTGNWLYMRLPSQRMLRYPYPRIERKSMPWIDGRTGVAAWKWAVTYEGTNSVTHQWGKQYLYGGKTTENAVQGIARDVLRDAHLRLEEHGYPQILSVHDEPIMEVEAGFGSVAEVVQLMCAENEWNKGLPLAASGWRGPRYRK